MTAQSNNMFKVVSLRRPISLGGKQALEDEGGVARRQAILKKIGPGPADDDKPTKLQAARERRETLLRELRNLVEIRARTTALINKRLQDASQANIPSKAEVKVGVAKPGAVAKAATWLFGANLQQSNLRKLWRSPRPRSTLNSLTTWLSPPRPTLRRNW